MMVSLLAHVRMAVLAMPVEIALFVPWIALRSRILHLIQHVLYANVIQAPSIKDVLYARHVILRSMVLRVFRLYALTQRPSIVIQNNHLVLNVPVI